MSSKFSWPIITRRKRSKCLGKICFVNMSERHGREAAWDVVQRHEMVGVFKWPAMRGSKAMHHLPDCVKEYFTSATDAAEADPKARRATTTKTNCG